MNRESFKLRMKALKSYRESHPDKSYWDWRIQSYVDGGEDDDLNPFDYRGPSYEQMLLEMRLNNPATYDAIAALRAMTRSPSSERVTYINAAGELTSTANTLRRNVESALSPEDLPGIGDVIEAANIYRDVKNNDYSTAALAAAMWLLPGNWSRVLRRNRNTLDRAAINSLSEESLDKLYADAVTSGDNRLAQALRDAHFERVSGQDASVLYHGAPYGGFSSFNSSAINSTIGGASAKGEKGEFFTDDLPAAIRYAGNRSFRGDIPMTARLSFIDRIVGRRPELIHGTDRIPEEYRHGVLAETYGLNPVLNSTPLGLNYKNTVYPVYIRRGRTFDFDFEGRPWNNAPIELPSRYNLRLTRGYDDVLSQDFLDLNSAREAYNSYAFRHGSLDVSDLNNLKFDRDTRTRSIEKYSSAPDFYHAILTEQYVPRTTNGIVTHASDRGYETVVMRNVEDANLLTGNYPILDVVPLNRNNIKLADPITYDDSGNLIPLSRRDNFGVSDIRYTEGGRVSNDYLAWRNSLPDNLRNTDDTEYDMYQAYKSGAEPRLEEDGLYHLPSRDPYTGKVLKRSLHPTYWKGLTEDAKLGYKPYFIGTDTYTWNNMDGPFIPWLQSHNRD